MIMKSEQKLTINKLIANDIINYALDDAVCDNYVMGINEYLKDFDEDSKKYINENIDTILDDIEQSECVLDLEIDRSNNDIELDFIFAWGKLLNQVEQIVLDNSKLFNVELDFEDVREIANNILDDDEFNDDLINRIKNYDNGKDID